MNPSQTNGAVAVRETQTISGIAIKGPFFESVTQSGIAFERFRHIDRRTKALAARGTPEARKQSLANCFRYSRGVMIAVPIADGRPSHAAITDCKSAAGDDRERQAGLLGCSARLTYPPLEAVCVNGPRPRSPIRQDQSRTSPFGGGHSRPRSAWSKVDLVHESPRRRLQTK